MACSVCGGKGHNKRTCIAQKLEDAGVGDEIRDKIVDYLTDEITDAALAEMIELGLDCAMPGLGMTIKLGRYAWKFVKK